METMMRMITGWPEDRLQQVGKIEVYRLRPAFPRRRLSGGNSSSIWSSGNNNTEEDTEEPPTTSEKRAGESFMQKRRITSESMRTSGFRHTDEQSIDSTPRLIVTDCTYGLSSQGDRIANNLTLGRVPKHIRS
jgi:hypothetical protein